MGGTLLSGRKPTPITPTAAAKKLWCGLTLTSPVPRVLMKITDNLGIVCLLVRHYNSRDLRVKIHFMAFKRW